MGVRQLLHAIKNRVEGKAFELWEESDGRLTGKMGDEDIVTSKTNPLIGKVEADFAGIKFCPPKSYRASGSAAAPVSTFNGASTVGVLGKPASILIPANFLIDGSGQIEAKIRIRKTGTDAASYFQMHIGPTDGTGDPNVLAGAGSTQFSAVTPYDATFSILLSYKSGKFSAAFQRDVPNVGAGMSAIEFTGTYDNTVTNYLNFVITGATAGNTYDLLAYSVNVFQ